MSAESCDREFEVWAASLREEYDAFLRQTRAAMQAARRGHWIEDAQEHVRQSGDDSAGRGIDSPGSAG
jgi:hypothetical protein